MNCQNENILTINAGSLSIKMALYEMKEELVLKLSGKIENIGIGKSKLIIKKNNSNNTYDIDGDNYHSVNMSLIGWIETKEWFENIKAIGRRIVHSMQHREAVIINNDLLKQLQNISDYALLISTTRSKVKVHVIKTDEEIMIAKATGTIYKNFSA